MTSPPRWRTSALPTPATSPGRCSRSPAARRTSCRDDLGAEALDRHQGLRVRRAGGLAQADRDVVGAGALHPVLDGRADLLPGAVEEAVRGDALEREVLARSD